jgi:hypothetical protein
MTTLGNGLAIGHIAFCPCRQSYSSFKAAGGQNYVGTVKVSSPCELQHHVSYSIVVVLLRDVHLPYGATIAIMCQGRSDFVLSADDHHGTMIGLAP